MQAKTPVEIADHVSRKPAVAVAIAAVVFVGVHVAARPLFGASNVDLWAVNAVALLAVLWPASQSLAARQAVYAVVTPSIVAALLAFSYLEYRAHRDA
jgi:hypothetical protein